MRAIRFRRAVFWDLSLEDSIPSKLYSDAIKINEEGQIRIIPSCEKGRGVQIFISFGTLRHETEFMDDKSIIIHPFRIFSGE